MPKLPFMKFYPTDFLMDVQAQGLESRGALITLLCHIWHTSANGTVSLTNRELAKLFGVEEERATGILLDLFDAKIIDYVFNETRDDGGPSLNIITSRRIRKDKKSLKLNAKHQSLYKDRVRRESYESKQKVRHKKSEVRSQKTEKNIPNPPLFLIPEDLKPNEPEILEWLQYKKERREAYTPTGLKQLLGKIRALSPDKRKASIENSMAQNWKGIYETREETKKQTVKKDGFL